MQALPIIEDLDVIEYRCFSFPAGSEAVLVNVFFFEWGKEAFHWSIVQAIPAPAHGLGDLVSLQHGSIRGRSVLLELKWSLQRCNTEEGKLR
jgi:hypothetical protein